MKELSKQQRRTIYIVLGSLSLAILIFLYIFYQSYLTAFLICIASGALCGSFFYFFRKKNFYFDIWGGIAVGIIGGAVGSLAFDSILVFLFRVFKWLMAIPGVKHPPPVNIVAVMLGTVSFLFIVSKFFPGNRTRG